MRVDHLVKMIERRIKAGKWPQIKERLAHFPTEYDSRVLGVLTRNGGPMQARAIQAKVGHSRQMLNQRLAKLESVGYVRKVSLGVYEVVK